MGTLLWLTFIVLAHLPKQHLVCADKICQNFKFFIDQDLVEDHALEGHVIRNSTVDRVTQCHIMCKDDCRCLSMNYIHNTQKDNCQLNEVNKKMKPAALKYKAGAKYYDLVREYSIHGRRFSQGIDRCVNRCCQDNPCLHGGTCEEICDPTTVRFNCTCPAGYTGQRCEKIKPYPRNCKDLATNGAKISGKFDVYDSQKKPFQVYCDFYSEPGYVWTLIQSYSLANNNQFKYKRFGVDFPVNEEVAAINWGAYRLSLPHMQSLANASTYLRATCNFPDEGLVFTDYARAKLAGHDLFGVWQAQCRTYEVINIRDIECKECTAGTWQKGEMWHINSELSASAGCQFNGQAGAVRYEQNFGFYDHVNVNFRCTSSQTSTTQHWIGNMK
ncbi:hypothetical protein ACROYT_G027309 [Oculina patagonica]